MFTLFNIGENDFENPYWLGTFTTLEGAFQKARSATLEPIMIIEHVLDEIVGNDKRISFYELKNNKYEPIKNHKFECPY